MKKLFILVCVSLFGVASYAAPQVNLLSTESNESFVSQSILGDEADVGPIEVGAHGTYYDKLEAYFNEAQMPEISDIRGWYAGRCFFKHEPNEPIGGLSVLLEKEIPLGDQKDRGPLFPNVPATKVERKLHLLEDRSSPSTFDERGLEWEFEVERLSEISYSNLSEIACHEESLANEYKNQTRYSIRQMNGYLFSKATFLSDATYDGYPYQAGETSAYCYYFKKVRD